MATEEESAPARDLPPYPEMILAAVDAISDKSGSNKTAISKYIESNYQNLPEGHSLLLAHHLNKMKDAGELSFAKNSYMRPDPNAPPKRGRGRPPKPKAPLPPDYVPPPPRPRGRPPKSGSAGSQPKRRGRPPKKARPAAAPAAPPAPGVKRGRGRPPKAKPTVSAVGA